MFTFCILGDMGSGYKEQYDIAKSMLKNIKMNNVKFVCGLGDNIYPAGCYKTDDPQFIDKFEKPYKLIPNKIKFYMCLGNHDYGNYWDQLFRNCSNNQIEYGILSQKKGKKWYLPANYYTYSKNIGNVKVDFFVIDTNLDLMSDLLKKEQFKYISTAIKDSKSDWKVLYGHHTFISIAGHGNAEPELDKYLRELFKLGIDIYFNGHDHNKQIVEFKMNKRIIPIITCGTGGKVYDDDINYKNINKGSTLIWHSETLGFGTVFCDKKTLRLKMFDKNNKLEYEYLLNKNSKNIKTLKKNKKNNRKNKTYKNMKGGEFSFPNLTIKKQDKQGVDEIIKLLESKPDHNLLILKLISISYSIIKNNREAVKLFIDQFKNSINRFKLLRSTPKFTQLLAIRAGMTATGIGAPLASPPIPEMIYEIINSERLNDFLDRIKNLFDNIDKIDEDTFKSSMIELLKLVNITIPDSTGSKQGSPTQPASPEEPVPPTQSGSSEEEPASPEEPVPYEEDSEKQETPKEDPDKPVSVKEKSDVEINVGIEGEDADKSADAAAAAATSGGCNKNKVKKTKRKMKQKGGKLINSSSHSCVFRPNLTITKKDKSKNKISKIVFKPSDREYQINKLIKNIKGHNNYYNILHRIPNISYSEIKKQEKDIDVCLNKFKLNKEDIFESELFTGKWIKGGNLQEYFNKKFKTNNIKNIEKEFLNMMDKFINVFVGIIILNENNIVHLDIKPGNIMVDDNTFKIIDFGLSSTLDDIDHFKQRAYKESQTDRLYIWYPPAFLLSQLDLDELIETEKYINNYNFDNYKSNSYVYNNIRKFYKQNTNRTYIQPLEFYKVKYTKNKSKEEIDKKFRCELDTIDTYSLGMIFPYLFEKKNLLKYVNSSDILRPFFELFKLMINPEVSRRIRIYEATVLLNSLIVINSNKKVLPITEKIRNLLNRIEKNKL